MLWVKITEKQHAVLPFAVIESWKRVQIERALSLVKSASDTTFRVVSNLLWQVQLEQLVLLKCTFHL